MYRALSTQSWTRPTGEVEKTKTGEEIRWHRITGWKELGIVSSMKEAKEKFGGSPVLEDIGRLQ
jgi:hypothetical protein